MAVYSKVVVYNCKLLKLNFRCVLLITLLDTVEVKPRPKAHLKLPVNQQFTVKWWFRTCKVVVYSKAAVYTCKPLVYTCKPLLYKNNLKERCYLHNMQQSYDKNSCKPGIKYFTSVNHWFTTCKAAVYSKAVVYNL